MTPVVIEVALHCYYRCEALPLTPAVESALCTLITEGLIEVTQGEPGYKMTDKGRKYVRMLIETPMPVDSTKWQDPRD